MSQLEIRGVEVGPRWLGVEDTQETDLIAWKEWWFWGAGRGRRRPLF